MFKGLYWTIYSFSSFFFSLTLMMNGDSNLF